jgi:hypothetical protein
MFVAAMPQQTYPFRPFRSEAPDCAVVQGGGMWRGCNAPREQVDVVGGRAANNIDLFPFRSEAPDCESPCYFSANLFPVS